MNSVPVMLWSNMKSQNPLLNFHDTMLWGPRRGGLFLFPSSVPQHQAISTCIRKDKQTGTHWSLSNPKIIQHKPVEIKVTLSLVLLLSKHFPSLNSVLALFFSSQVSSATLDMHTWSVYCQHWIMTSVLKIPEVNEEKNTKPKIHWKIICAFCITGCNSRNIFMYVLCRVSWEIITKRRPSGDTNEIRKVKCLESTSEGNLWRPGIRAANTVGSWTDTIIQNYIQSCYFTCFKNKTSNEDTLRSSFPWPPCQAAL